MATLSKHGKVFLSKPDRSIVAAFVIESFCAQSLLPSVVNSIVPASGPESFFSHTAWKSLTERGAGKYIGWSPSGLLCGVCVDVARPPSTS